MKIIFENENGQIADLGMRGEFPYSSKVGRRLVTPETTEEIWFATEINPSGTLRVDRKVAEWKEMLMGKFAQLATA